MLFFLNKKVDLSFNCVIMYVQLEIRRKRMQKKIQIVMNMGYYTSKENFKQEQFESDKHDSIQAAEYDIDWMMQVSLPKNIKITSKHYDYNIVNCYKDEMTDRKYG